MIKFKRAIIAAVLTLTALLIINPAFAYAEDAKPILEKVKAALNLRAAIGSGVVSAKNSNSLTVTKDSKSYTVNFDSSTKLRRKFWGTSSIDEIQVGDTVNILGKWTDDTKTIIQARLIRDASIQKRFGVFFGTITASTGSSFTMTTVNRGSQTVTVSASTKLMNRKEEIISGSDIKVGDKVRVRGLWDKTNSTITEVSHVKDFSIPAK